MFNSDFVIISMFNNGFGSVITENGTFECTKDEAEYFILNTRNTHKEVAYKMFENGDKTYWFN